MIATIKVPGNHISYMIVTLLASSNGPAPSRSHAHAHAHCATWTHIVRHGHTLCIINTHCATWTHIVHHQHTLCVIDTHCAPWTHMISQALSVKHAHKTEHHTQAATTRAPRARTQGCWWRLERVCYSCAWQGWCCWGWQGNAEIQVRVGHQRETGGRARGA